MDVLRTVVVYAHGYALVEACFLGSAVCGPWPEDELSQMRRVSQMVPRDAPRPPGAAGDAVLRPL